MADNSQYDFPGFNLKWWSLGGLSQLRLSPTKFASLQMPTDTSLPIAYISDSNTVTYGAAIAGGGAHKALAWWNGTNWLCIIGT